MGCTTQTPNVLCHACPGCFWCVLNALQEQYLTGDSLRASTPWASTMSSNEAVNRPMLPLLVYISHYHLAHGRPEFHRLPHPLDTELEQASNSSSPCFPPSISFVRAEQSPDVHSCAHQCARATMMHTRVLALQRVALRYEALEICADHMAGKEHCIAAIGYAHLQMWT